MLKKKEKAVVIWSDGFPYIQNASNEKNSLIAKALILADYDVYLTSKIDNGENINNEGNEEGIQYCNFSRHQAKPNLIRYLFAIFYEIKFILSLKKKYNCLYLLGSYTSIAIYFFYSIICNILRVKIVLSIMEWHIYAHKNLSVLTRMNSYLFDKYAFRLSKGTIAISELIITNLKNFSSNEKFLLIPALTDVNKIDKVKNLQTKNFNYVLYCGGLGYYEVIETIIDAFQELKSDIHLVLILHGNDSQLEKIRTKIEYIRLSNKIDILCNLSYENLIQYYKNALILLVPLRDSMQDQARYPQKIAEYAACVRPIMSNPIGQVGLDFSHKTDIYFANSCTSNDLAEGMREIIQDDNLAERITINARVKAEQYFDYKNYCNKLDQFLMNL